MSNYIRQFKCDECKKKFEKKNALKAHKRDKHAEEESFADRTVNAMIDNATGRHNEDYDWLVEPYL